MKPVHRGGSDRESVYGKRIRKAYTESSPGARLWRLGRPPAEVKSGSLLVRRHRACELCTDT
jgi:hypothetical protein